MMNLIYTIVAALLSLAYPAAAQPPTEVWQLKAIQLYPALGVSGSPFNLRFVALHQEWERLRSKQLQDPQWPLRLAEQVAAELNPPAVTSLPSAAVPPLALQTPEQVKQRWLNELVEPHPLSAQYYPIRQSNAARRSAILSGRRDAEAQDEADRTNTAWLRQQHRTAEADLLEQEQTRRAAARALAQQQAAQQRQVSELRDLAASLKAQKEALERQTEELKEAADRLRTRK